MQQKSWTVEVSLTEEGNETRATTMLTTDDGREFRGDGIARRNPADAEIPQIGDELATARALGELAHRLLETAAQDIEQSTDQPTRLVR
jgi:hypothetical protein